MSLSRSGTPRNGPSGSVPRCLAARRVEPAVDDGVELGIDALDPLDRRLHELEGLHVAAPHEVGLVGRVEGGQVVDHERRR